MIRLSSAEILEELLIELSLSEKSGVNVRGAPPVDIVELSEILVLTW